MRATNQGGWNRLRIERAKQAPKNVVHSFSKQWRHMNYIYEEQQECKMARKMANVPSCTKSDFTFGAYSHRHTCIHTLLQIGRERARGGWMTERELSTDTHSQKYRTDSDRRRKIMNLNINLKYLFYTNEIQRVFFAPFYRLLFFLSAFTFRLSGAFLHVAAKIVCEMKNLIYRASLPFNYVLRPAFVPFILFFEFFFTLFVSFK